MTQHRNLPAVFWRLFVVSSSALLLALLADSLSMWGAANPNKFLSFLSPSYQAQVFAPAMNVIGTFSGMCMMVAWTGIYIIALQFGLRSYGIMTAAVSFYYLLIEFFYLLFYHALAWSSLRFLINGALIPVLRMALWFGAAKLLMLITRRWETLSFIILVVVRCGLATLPYWPVMLDENVSGALRQGYIEKIVQEGMKILWFLCIYGIFWLCRKWWRKKGQRDHNETGSVEEELPPIVL